MIDTPNTNTGVPYVKTAYTFRQRTSGNYTYYQAIQPSYIYISYAKDGLSIINAQTTLDSTSKNITLTAQYVQQIGYVPYFANSYDLCGPFYGYKNFSLTKGVSQIYDYDTKEIHKLGDFFKGYAYKGSNTQYLTLVSSYKTGYYHDDNNYGVLKKFPITATTTWENYANDNGETCGITTSYYMSITELDDMNSTYKMYKPMFKLRTFYDDHNTKNTYIFKDNYDNALQFDENTLVNNIKLQCAYNKKDTSYGLVSDFVISPTIEAYTRLTNKTFCNTSTNGMWLNSDSVTYFEKLYPYTTNDIKVKIYHNNK